MTKRNPDIKSNPMTISFVGDYEAVQKFKEIVGDQNFSREIRAMIRKRIEQSQDNNNSARAQVTSDIKKIGVVQ